MHRNNDSQWEERYSLGPIIPGIILVALGALFLLNNLHIIQVREFFRYWPVILIALGLARLLDSGQAGPRPDGLILIVAGAALLAVNLRFLALQYRDLWPLLLIALGIWMLWQRVAPAAPPPPPDADPGSYLTGSVVFGGVKRKITSQDFQGGRVSTVCGGVELDLRWAVMRAESVTLDISAVLGGIEIRVPENWVVVVQARGVFAGFDDRTAHPDPSATPDIHRLIVTGSAVLAGVEIKN
jgi:hypothetical protein